MPSEIALVGPFSENQREIIGKGLNEEGHDAKVKIYPHATEVPSEAIIAVRGGVEIPAGDWRHVISGGRGTGNIVEQPGREIYDCRGENAPETAAHGVAMALIALNETRHDEYVDLSTIKVGIIGAGYVGVSAGILCEELGMNVKLVQREGKEVPGDLSDILTGDIGAVMEESDIVIMAASGKDILTLDNVSSLKSLRKTKILVNIARAAAVEPDAFAEIRQTKGLVARNDVWYKEPQAGNAFPLVTAQIITGNDRLNPVLGTMHQAARQESSNTAVAHRLVKIINAIIKGGEVPTHRDPLDLYRNYREQKGERRIHDLVSLQEIWDVKRVSRLMKALSSIAERVVREDNVPYVQPPIEPNSRDSLVYKVRRILNAN